MVGSEAPTPQAGERLTREDVLRLTKEHGGPKELDLGNRDLREGELQDLDLRGAYLWWANLQAANLVRANLQGAYLLHANLQGANLFDANLQGANLFDASLQGTRLSFANLQQADLSGADLRGAHLARASLRDANLEGANWGDYVLGDETAGEFDQVISVYRALKQQHTEAGMYDVAGEFHYREMESRRKLAWKGAPRFEARRRLPYAAALYALRFLYGYGERPERVIGWAAGIIIGLAVVHWLFGTVTGGFPEALYYSAVSFTALGYGAWAPEPQGWAGRFLGVGEAVMGVFMMALFLVTFTRKMTR